METQPALNPKPSKLPLIIIIIMLLIVSLGISAYLYYQTSILQQQLNSLSQQTKTPPLPTPEEDGPPLEDPTAAWQTFVSESGNYSFKYPQPYFQYLNEQKSSVYLAPTEGKGETAGTPQSLTHNDVWLTVSVAPATSAQKDQPKELIQSTAPQKVNSFQSIFVRSGKAYKIVLSSYQIQTLKSRERLYDQILSTFRFTGDYSSETSNAVTGTITGSLCYPGSYVPPGTIEAKNATTQIVYSTRYAGTSKEPNTNYQIKVPTGSYYLRFKTDKGPLMYHTHCAIYPDDCTGTEAHQQLIVKVNPGEVTSEIKLCDYLTLVNDNFE